MVNIFKFGRSVGPKKVNMPDLSGLTKTEAETLLNTKGIPYTSSPTSTSDSNLASKIASQATPANETILLGSNIEFTFYNYAPYFPYFPSFAPAPVTPPVSPAPAPVTPPVSPAPAPVTPPVSPAPAPVTPPVAPAPYFPPYFPYFNAACIDQDTLVLVSADLNSFCYKMAKDINLGDKIVSATWDGLISEKNFDPLSWSSETLANFKLIDSSIISVSPSAKEVTAIINGNLEQRFSLEHTILIKRNSINMFISLGSVEDGDVMYEIGNDLKLKEVLIESVDLLDESRDVYKFDADPYDIIFAGNIATHNFKVYF